MSETKIAIFIHDSTYGQNDPGEEEKSRALKAQLEAELGVPLKDFDIGPGWSEPVFLFELAEAAWPYVAAAFALFLSGKPILDGLEAWPKLYEKIRPFRRHKPTFNREAASIVAVHETASKLGAEPRSLRLIAYSTGDRTGGPYDLDALSEIGEAPRDDRLGAFAHLFRIEFNGQTFNVTVEGNMVTVIEVT